MSPPAPAPDGALMEIFFEMGVATPHPVEEPRREPSPLFAGDPYYDRILALSVSGVEPAHGGEAHAVGAVVYGGGGELLDQFRGRCPPPEGVHSSVLEYELPRIADWPVEYADAKELRAAFWKWYVAAARGAALFAVTGTTAAPVRFLNSCYGQSPGCWFPFMVHDVGTAFLVRGVDPLGDPSQYVEDMLDSLPGPWFTPLWKAHVEALCILRVLGRLPSRPQGSGNIPPTHSTEGPT